MPTHKPTCVIFDMDGTTVAHIHPRLLHVLERLDDFAYAAKNIWAGKNPAEITKRTKPPRLLVHRALHHLRRKEVDQIVKPCDGIYDVLNFLKSHDISMGLVSNGLGQGYGHDVLEKFDLEKYFLATVFREDITRAKPDPEGILLTLKRMGITPTQADHIWYIGDRHKDITAALAAQTHLPCKIVPLAYGLNATAAVLERGLPLEHIILSYADLYQRLYRIFGEAPKKIPAHVTPAL